MAPMDMVDVDVDAVDVDAVDVAPGGAMMGSRWDQEGQGARVSVKDSVGPSGNLLLFIQAT